MHYFHIVRLFVYWYSGQQFLIRWGNTVSNKFSTTNCVRQGGIIYPAYFNVYMDDLIKELNKSEIGCCINGHYINNLLYADDSCIVASSPSGLQKLIDICSEYATANTIVFNESKTKCVCFKPKCLKNLHVPSIFLNNNELESLH